MKIHASNLVYITGFESQFAADIISQSSDNKPWHIRIQWMNELGIMFALKMTSKQKLTMTLGWNAFKVQYAKTPWNGALSLLSWHSDSKRNFGFPLDHNAPALDTQIRQTDCLVQNLGKYYYIPGIHAWIFAVGNTRGGWNLALKEYVHGLQWLFILVPVFCTISHNGIISLFTFFLDKKQNNKYICALLRGIVLQCSFLNIYIVLVDKQNNDYSHTL